MSLSVVVETYGPFAFGLLCLLILWKTIMEPQMRQAREMATITSETANTFKQTSEVLNRSIETANTIVKRLESLVHEQNEGHR